MKALIAGQGRHVQAYVIAELESYGHEVAAVGQEDLGELHAGAAAGSVAIMCGFETCIGSGAMAPAEEDLLAEHETLHAMVSAGALALVLLSSAAVYGLDDVGGQLDEQTDVRPTTRLGRHAVSLEATARELTGSARIPLLILRTSIIAGAEADVAQSDRIPKSAQLLPGLSVSGLEYPVMKTVYHPRLFEHARLADFVSTSDVAYAVRLAAEKLTSGADIPDLLTIGSGVMLHPERVLAALQARTDILLDTGATAPENEPLAALSYRLAETVLGWKAGTPVDEIVENELSFMRADAFAPHRADKTTRVANWHLRSSLSADALTIWGALVLGGRTGGPDLRDLRFSANGTQYAADFLPREGIGLPRPRGSRIALYRLQIPRETVEAFPTQTAVRLVYSGPQRRWFDVPLPYSRPSSKARGHHGPLFAVHDGTSRLFVRQSAGNRVYLTLRENNVTDTFRSKLKVLAARIAAFVHRKNSILFYEKESSRYEESASVVFEELLNRGHKDVYFLLDAAALDQVPERYRSKVILRFSFSHFLHFFTARTLVGTEVVAHAAELRTVDRLLQRRMRSNAFGFVFLQHGVMYMVALSSTQRSFFRAGAGFPKNARIVCSSELEKRHFVELGGYRPESMYVCGLPKFDRSERDPHADRILIMPTWRPWEHTVIRTDPEGSGYFRMLEEMFEAVPEELRELVWILPHPLVREQLKSTALDAHLWPGDSYDAALRQCAVLLTDYSSIAYDAFYRGANVVFWWKDKDDCMRHYGGHLMIDERTAIGSVCYDAAALKDAIAAAHSEPQASGYLDRYQHIVEFRDGRNTERLIDMMHRDRLL